MRIYNDENKELNIGDMVTIESLNNTYIGTIKKILPNALALNLSAGKGVQILYKNIDKII